MDNIKKYQSLIRDTSSAFRIYLSKLEFSGFSGVEPVLTNFINKETNVILEDTELSELLIKNEYTIGETFRIQFLINSFYYSLKKCRDIFYQNKLDMSKQGTKTSSGSTLSYTYLSNLNESFDQILDIYNVLKNEYNREIIPNFLSINIKDLDALATSKKTYEKYLENGTGQHVIRMYMLSLQKTISNNAGIGKDIIKQIIKDVEELKTSTLIQSYPLRSECKNKKANVIQRIVQKFNLVPNGMDKPLPILLEDITSNSVQTLPNIAKLLSSTSKKFGFIVITKTIDRPIVHNIWTLISQEYLEQNDLIQEKSVGINKKSLERSKTIIIRDVNKRKTENSIVFINNLFDKGDPLKNCYFIIETLDGVLYHFLLPWLSSSIKYVPASWFESIENTERTPSRRISAYNNILNTEILSNLQDPFVEMMLMTRDEIRREESYWKNLRHTIKNTTMARIKDYLLKWEFISIEKVKKLLSDPQIYKNIISIIIEQISIDNIVPTDISNMNQVNIELFISYFRDIDKIQKGLKHDMVETYKKEYEEKLEKTIGVDKVSESKTAMARNQILLILENVLNEVLEKYINRRSNIYLSIDKKLELLSKTIL